MCVGSGALSGGDVPPSPHPQDETLAWESQDVSSENVSSQDVSPQDVSPQDVSPQDVSPQDVSPQDVSPQNVSSQDVSPGREDLLQGGSASSDGNCSESSRFQEAGRTQLPAPGDNLREQHMVVETKLRATCNGFILQLKTNEPELKVHVNVVSAHGPKTRRNQEVRSSRRNQEEPGGTRRFDPLGGTRRSQEEPGGTRRFGPAGGTRRFEAGGVVQQEEERKEAGSPESRAESAPPRHNWTCRVQSLCFFQRSADLGLTSIQLQAISASRRREGHCAVWELRGLDSTLHAPLRLYIRGVVVRRLQQVS
ncbi:unnamed protein product [Pleuronectes platessa]|uniref:Uncharacterized protein n=1 Tax=Pleuronectes platessa TaxID=8262 RepID=A0A9N7TYG8_PLEPL|nr:unnamed protein product [Pleuronectes platessa]